MMDERAVVQEQPFHGFRPERQVSDDRPLPASDRFAGPRHVRRQLAPFCSLIGRP